MEQKSFGICKSIGGEITYDAWAATSESNLAKIQRLCKVISGTQH